MVPGLPSRSDALAAALGAADARDAPDARLPDPAWPCRLSVAGSPADAQDAHRGQASPSVVAVATDDGSYDIIRLICFISGSHGCASPDSPPTKRGANHRQGLGNLTFPGILPRSLGVNFE